jgi:hypothetical protein
MGTVENVGRGQTPSKQIVVDRQFQSVVVHLYPARTFLEQDFCFWCVIDGDGFIVCDIKHTSLVRFGVFRDVTVLEDPQQNVLRTRA